MMSDAQSSRSTSSRVLKFVKCKICGMIGMKDVDCKTSNTERNPQKLFWRCTHCGEYVDWVKDREVNLLKDLVTGDLASGDLAACEVVREVQQMYVKLNNEVRRLAEMFEAVEKELRKTRQASNCFLFLVTLFLLFLGLIFSVILSAVYS